MNQDKIKYIIEAALMVSDKPMSVAQIEALFVKDMEEVDRELIKAALEVGKRATAAPLTTGQRVTSSGDVFRHYRPLMRDLRREVFKVVLLDGKNAIIRDVTVSEGSLTLSIVHPREAFVPAVKESAAAVIFVHNHPSGDPAASPEDRALTRRLVSVGEIIGIRVLDHVIIGDRQYVSFADEGWLTP